MIMEHRWGTRRNLHLDIIIHSRGQGAVPARVHNISSSGLYAETGHELELNQPVTAEFSHPSRPLIYLLSAYVIRATPDGVALMFNEPDTKELSRLLERLAESEGYGPGDLPDSDLRHPKRGGHGVN